MAKITHVAIKYRGMLYSLPRPNRHHHVILKIYEETWEDVGQNEQGFLDSDGVFLTRQEALVRAQEEGQLLEDTPVHPPNLYSENLW